MNFFILLRIFLKGRYSLIFGLFLGLTVLVISLLYKFSIKLDHFSYFLSFCSALLLLLLLILYFDSLFVEGSSRYRYRGFLFTILHIIIVLTFIYYDVYISYWFYVRETLKAFSEVNGLGCAGKLLLCSIRYAFFFLVVGSFLAAFLLNFYFIGYPYFNELLKEIIFWSKLVSFIFIALTSVFLYYCHFENPFYISYFFTIKATAYVEFLVYCKYLFILFIILTIYPFIKLFFLDIVLPLFNILFIKIKKNLYLCHIFFVIILFIGFFISGVLISNPLYLPSTFYRIVHLYLMFIFFIYLFFFFRNLIFFTFNRRYVYTYFKLYDIVIIFITLFLLIFSFHFFNFFKLLPLFIIKLSHLLLSIVLFFLLIGVILKKNKKKSYLIFLSYKKVLVSVLFIGFLTLFIFMYLNASYFDYIAFDPLFIYSNLYHFLLDSFFKPLFCRSFIYFIFIILLLILLVIYLKNS